MSEEFPRILEGRNCWTGCIPDSFGIPGAGSSASQALTDNVPRGVGIADNSFLEKQLKDAIHMARTAESMPDKERMSNSGGKPPSVSSSSAIKKVLETAEGESGGTARASQGRWQAPGLSEWGRWVAHRWHRHALALDTLIGKEGVSWESNPFMGLVIARTVPIGIAACC